MNKLSLLVIVLLLSAVLFVPLQFAKADRWVEVVRYEGKSADFVTASFVCNYSEWRIRYESYLGTHFPMIIPGVYDLNVTTYRQGETTNYIDKINAFPTQGQYYINVIHNKTGTFYMNISTDMIDSYSVIVEQNTDSVLATPTPAASSSPTVPEFTPAAGLVLAVAVAISLIYFKASKKKTNTEATVNTKFVKQD
jgi:hypothetical protein